MKGQLNFQIKLVFISILLFSSAVSNYGITYTKPVIASSIPAQIEVTHAAGEMLLVLKGNNFLIPEDSPIWNARNIILYVRHSAKGGPWQGLHNNLRDGGQDYGTYPNPPRAFGNCYYDSDSKIRVWLPRNIWCNSQGTLQFLIIKGQWGHGPPPMMVTEKVRSDVYGVPVKGTVTGITEIHSLIPEFYYVNQKNPYPLVVKGKFDFGTKVLIDNKECKTKVSNPQTGLIQIHLPPGLLNVQAMHSVRLKDSQNTPCAAKTLWVYGPPKVTKISPTKLRTGMAKTEIKIRFGGLKPKGVKAKVAYTAPQSSSSAPPPTSWTPLPSSSPKPERITLFLDSKWMVYEGWLKIRLESDAGNTELKIPIKTPTPAVKYRPPAKVIKKPIKLKVPLSSLKYRPQLKELARMIVELKPDRLIRDKANRLFKRIQSDTKGSSKRPDKNFLKSLKDQINKEIWKNEKQKNKQLTQAQRKQIQKLIQMIQQMMKLH